MCVIVCVTIPPNDHARNAPCGCEFADFCVDVADVCVKVMHVIDLFQYF
jgi:hypothetical protein